VAFQRHGTSRDLLERLAGPYSWEWRHHSRFFCSEHAWEEWREQVVSKFVGMMQGDLATISRDDLRQLKEAAKRKAMLEHENSDLRKALAHFHRPVTEVFSKENCRRINPLDWDGRSILMSVRTRVLQMFENDNIGTVGDLVRVREYEILRAPGMGRKSLNFIKEVLADMGLHLGMKVPDET
jgi:DNA-directed RNA polymerase alpha subunit